MCYNDWTTRFVSRDYGTYTTHDGRFLAVHLPKLNAACRDAHVEVTLPSGAVYLRVCSEEAVAEVLREERDLGL